MAGEPNVTLTIDLNDPNLDTEEHEEDVQRLLNQLREVDEVENVNRVLDPNPPEGKMRFPGVVYVLAGILTVEVNPANAKKLMGFLGDRLGNKPVKLKVKAPDGRELELEASSREEFDYAYEKVQAFLKGISRTNY